MKRDKFGVVGRFNHKHFFWTVKKWLYHYNKTRNRSASEPYKGKVNNQHLRSQLNLYCWFIGIVYSIPMSIGRLRTISSKEIHRKSEDMSSALC